MHLGLAFQYVDVVVLDFTGASEGKDETRRDETRRDETRRERHQSAMGKPQQQQQQQQQHSQGASAQEAPRPAVEAGPCTARDLLETNGTPLANYYYYSAAITQTGGSREGVREGVERE